MRRVWCFEVEVFVAESRDFHGARCSSSNERHTAEQVHTRFAALQGFAHIPLRGTSCHALTFERQDKLGTSGKVNGQ